MVLPKGNNKEKKRRRKRVGKAGWAEVRTKRIGPNKREGTSWARKREERNWASAVVGPVLHLGLSLHNCRLVPT